MNFCVYESLIDDCFEEYIFESTNDKMLMTVFCSECGKSHLFSLVAAFHTQEELWKYISEDETLWADVE